MQRVELPRGYELEEVGYNLLLKRPNGYVLATGLATGVAVGLLQWWLLRGRVRVAGLWPPVVAIAWPLGWTVTWAADVDVERSYAVFGSTGALVYAAITGAAMRLMLRGSRRAAVQRRRAR